MPVIPQYQRKVGEADAPSVRSPMNHTADEFGAPVAKAMGQLGAVAEDISVKMDRAAVVQAENYLRTKTTEALYGENGILKRKGAAAANADKEFDKSYETILAETRKGLSGRAARSFELLAGQYKSQLFPSIQGHIAKQAEVAQDEALAGQEYADTMEMANKWRDRNAVAVMLTKGEAAVRARYAGHDPAFVAAKVQLRNSNVLRARAEALYKEGQTDDLREYLGLYEKHMNPNDVAGWKGWIKQKDENAAMSSEADRIAAMFGDNLAGAVEYIRGLKNQGTKELPVPDTGKYFTGNTSGMNGTLVNRLARLAADKGINIVVTSGRRTKEEQAALYEKYQRGEGNLAAAPGNSRHESGAAIDTDSLEGISDDELRKYGLARTVEGESWHYEAVGGTASRDPEYYDKLERSVMAKVSKNRAIKNDIELRALENLEDALAQTTDPTKRLQLIRESGLPPRRISRFETAEANNRESDLTMEMRLKFLDDSGKLTPADVEAANEAGLLSSKSYRSWMMKSVDSGSSRIKTEEEKRRKAIDADIALRIEKEFAGKKEDERSLIKKSIYATLDERGIKGEERLAEARKLMAAEQQSSGIVYSNFVGRRDQMNDMLSKYPEKADVVRWLANSAGVKIAEFEPFIAGLNIKDPEVVQALRNMQSDGAQLTPRNFEYALDRVRAKKAWARGDQYVPRVAPPAPADTADVSAPELPAEN